MWLHLREIIRRIIFIGFGIQIAMGIVWMAYALADEAARTGSLGECVPGLLRLGLAWFACAYFLGSIERGGRAEEGRRAILRHAYGGLGLAAFPMAMQCYVAADGHSVQTSLLLLAAACVVRLLRSGSARPIRKADRLLLCVLAVAAGGTVLYSAYENSQAETQENPGTWLASRFAWSTLGQAEEEWPHELFSIFDDCELWNTSYYPEELERTMIPQLEEKVGTEAAEEYLYQIAALGWQNHRGQILKEIIWDAAGYAAAPIVFQLQMSGRAYDSLSGRNYEALLRVEPRLAKVYMDYGCKWYVVLLVLTALLWAAERFSRKKRAADPAEAPQIVMRRSRADRLAGLMPWLAAVLLVAYCTMRRGGLMDYRDTVYVLYLTLGSSYGTDG